MKLIILLPIILFVIFLIYIILRHLIIQWIENEENVNTKDYKSSWFKIQNYNDLLKQNINISTTTIHVTSVPSVSYQTTENRRYDILKPDGVNNLPVMIYFQPTGDNGIVGQGSNDNSALKQSLNILAMTNKICIVFLYPDPNNVWYWMEECVNYDFKCPRPRQTTAFGIPCFSKHCPDDLYLSQVRDHITNDTSLNLNKLAVIGYSAGAQMASFAISKFKELGFPDITVACLIAGGVQYCYAYYSNNLPKIFKPCKNAANTKADAPTLARGWSVGCCPYNTLERSYMEGTHQMSEHPPTFLFQTDSDSWADQNASINYYNSAVKFNVATGKIIALNSSYHGLIYIQANPFINIIKRYLSI